MNLEEAIKHRAHCLKMTQSYPSFSADRQGWYRAYCETNDWIHSLRVSAWLQSGQVGECPVADEREVVYL